MNYSEMTLDELLELRNSSRAKIAALKNKQLALKIA